MNAAFRRKGCVARGAEGPPSGTSMIRAEEFSVTLRRTNLNADLSDGHASEAFCARRNS
jgi:hypothetical protein